MFLFSASFWLTVLAVITVLFAYLASTNPFFIRSLYCDSLGHPMPKGWVPFFGHLFVLDLRRFNDSSWALIKDLPKTTGAVTMWLFGQPFLIPVTAAAGKDAVKRLEHVKDPAVYKPVEGVFGRNIVTMNGRSWARLRRIISPAFRPNWLKRLVPWAKSSSEVFIGRMEKIAEENEGVVKVDDELMQMTLSIIAASAFGNNLGYSVDSTKLSSPVATAFNELMELAQQLFENPWLLTMSSSARQTLKRNRELLDGILRDALAEVRAGDKVDVDADVSKGERATIMQVLAHAHDAETGEGLTDEEIMSNALVMLLAGTDTTAHTLSFTLHALASDADLQDAVHAECSRLLAGRDFLDMSELSQLELTTRVIMETLRLFPLAIGTSRILPTGAQLGPTVLKEKTPVFVLQHALHQDTEQWGDDASEFKPDRWLPEAAAKRSRFAFHSFSAGPQDCVGKPLSMMEMRMLLPLLVTRFRFELVPGEAYEVVDSGTTKPATGMPLRLVAR